MRGFMPSVGLRRFFWAYPIVGMSKLKAIFSEPTPTD
jgi:hypothetical protein